MGFQLIMLANKLTKKIFLNFAGVFILIVAVILRVPQLYLMAAILLLIPFVSYCAGRLLMLGLACERVLPASCSEGERVPVILRVTNTGLLPKFLLRVRDRLPEWVTTAADAPPILQLWPGETGSAAYFLEPKKRGVYPLGAVQVVSVDPLGFYAFSQDVPAASELVVYPTVLPLSRAALDGGGTFGRRESEGTLVRGGMDFDGVREWRPGDELRRVHWRTTARTGELAVVEYAQGMTSDITLALDLNKSNYANTGTGPNSALEVAIRMAASLAAAFLREGWTVRFLSSETEGLPLVLTEPAHLPRLLEVLARASVRSDRALASALDAERAAGTAGGGLVFVTPDAPSLLTALEGWNGPVRGWVLDRASFTPAPKRPAPRKAPADTDGAFVSAGMVGTVRQGDDLLSVLEGLSYARRQ